MWHAWSRFCVRAIGWPRGGVFIGAPETNWPAPQRGSGPVTVRQMCDPARRG
jgi:hypothetical protein